MNIYENLLIFNINSVYLHCYTLEVLQNIDKYNILNIGKMADSTKRSRFTKVASTRVSKILNYLTLLQNCANRNNYEYDADDVEQMFAEINKAVKDAKNVYLNELAKQNSKGGFTFNK